MRIRATFGSVAPPPSLILTLQFPIPLPPLTIYLDRWYLRRHFCDISRPTVDFQVAAQQRHPLTHAGETQTLAGPTPVGALLRVEARPPIPHVQAHSAVQAPECDLSSFRPVPPHLRQRIASKTSQPSWSMEPKNTHPSRQKSSRALLVRRECGELRWLPRGKRRRRAISLSRPQWTPFLLWARPRGAPSPARPFS